LVGKIFNKKPPKLLNPDESKIAKRATIDLTSQFVETDVLSRENLEKTKSVGNIEVEYDTPLMSVDEVLKDFQWDAGGDASALEKRLMHEIQALESVR
jgi:hypothetical protein